MLIEEAIFSHLTASGTEAEALAGDRCYPQELPQQPTYPAYTYRRVSTQRYMAHDGPGDLGKPRFQFDCYGASYGQAKQLANAIRQDLNGFNGLLGGQVQANIHFLNEIDDFASEATRSGVHRVAVDFLIIHKEEA